MLLPRVPRSGSQSIGVPDLFAGALCAQRMLTDAGLPKSGRGRGGWIFKSGPFPPCLLLPCQPSEQLSGEISIRPEYQLLPHLPEARPGM